MNWKLKGLMVVVALGLLVVLAALPVFATYSDVEGTYTMKGTGSFITTEGQRYESPPGTRVYCHNGELEITTAEAGAITGTLTVENFCTALPVAGSMGEQPGRDYFIMWGDTGETPDEIVVVWGYFNTSSLFVPKGARAVYVRGMDITSKFVFNGKFNASWAALE